MAESSDAPLVTSPDELSRLCGELRAGGSFAFDTEFVGEDAYQPEICLVQVATHERCVLIDPLAGVDTRPFWELVADEAVTKIVHAGGEDLALCRRQFGLCPMRVVDLQIAAGLVGLGYPASLARLVNLVLDRRLHKSQTLTDWRRRPLGPDQLHYAVEDVAHLPAVYDELMKRIEKLGRRHWLEEECRAAADAAGRNTDDLGLKRLRGTSSMSRKQLAIVAAIVSLRDELARKYDRPARAVLKDHIAVEMARSGWTDPQKLRALRGINISNADLKRFAQAIEAAKQSPPDSWPIVSDDEPGPEEETLLSLLTAVLRSFCEANHLAYSLLATKQDLRQFVKAPRSADGAIAPSESPAILLGWRGEAVGRLIEKVVSGQASVRVVRRGMRFQLVVE